MAQQWGEGEQEMMRLAAILEAEATGAPVDRGEAARLAGMLKSLWPELAGNMQRIIDRMAEPSEPVMA
jgi:hypothetical protein